MKSFLMVWVLMASYTGIYSQSCCCTGAGANYSILPNLNKQVLGVRYTYRSYISETHSLNPEMNGMITSQQLNTLEIFGRFNLNKRLQLSVFLPVSFIHQHSMNSDERTAGLGDMSFLLQYAVLDPLKCNGKKSKHQLRLGVGTKLPSGEFKMNANDMFNTSLQLGTGSVDFIFNGIYTYRFKKFGFNASAAYGLNTTNTKGYRFGDKTLMASNVFYIFDVKEISIMPSIGFNYEHLSSDRLKKTSLDNTGGDFLTSSIGLDVYYKQFAFSSAFYPALMNRLNWENGNKNKFNFEAGVFYNFSINKK